MGVTVVTLPEFVVPSTIAGEPTRFAVARLGVPFTETRVPIASVPDDAAVSRPRESTVMLALVYDPGATEVTARLGVTVVVAPEAVPVNKTSVPEAKLVVAKDAVPLT